MVPPDFDQSIFETVMTFVFLMSILLGPVIVSRVREELKKGTDEIMDINNVDNDEWM